MHSRQELHARDHEAKHVGMCVDRLELMFEWYKGMVDKGTSRLLYVYRSRAGCRDRATSLLQRATGTSIAQSGRSTLVT